MPVSRTAKINDAVVMAAARPSAEYIRLDPPAIYGTAYQDVVKR